jgi:hypothetical protein
MTGATVKMTKAGTRSLYRRTQLLLLLLWFDRLNENTAAAAALSMTVDIGMSLENQHLFCATTA